jgi:hypothetical protein
MKIFDLKDNQVIISPEVLSIKVFKDIWDGDKTKEKINAYNSFKYIYHICDFNSPYNNYSFEKRKKAVIEEVIGNNGFEENEIIKQACQVYSSLSVTPIERLFNEAKEKIHQMADYLNNNEIDENTLPTVLKIIDSTSKIVGQYKTLEQAVKNEKETSSSRIKGDKKVDANFNE